jgi:hypothetical protein
MSDRVLVVGCLVFMVGACTRPLNGIDPAPDAGSSPGSPTGGRDAAPPLDGSPAIGPAPDSACWSNQLPPQVQPMLPQAAVADVCAAAAATPATSWTLAVGLTQNADGRAFIVGRWSACGTENSGFSFIAHDGVEFGANGRWRLLALDASGSFVPVAGSSAAGYYYLLGSGQLNVTIDQTGGTRFSTLKFADGVDALQFSTSGNPPSVGNYARSTPSPLNGNDNLPSVSDGTCSMVGTWDVPAGTSPSGSAAAAFSFDAAGNFIGGAFGADLCAGHTMDGTYQLRPGTFELTSGVGLGSCQWWYTASYGASFSPDCSSLTLTRQTDNCTGGRLYLNGQTSTMTRRQ